MIKFLYSIGMTDAMITSSVITIVLSAVAIAGGRALKKNGDVKSSGGKLQTALEIAVEKLYNFFEGIMGEYACRKYFPLVATIFIVTFLLSSGAYSYLALSREPSPTL